MTGAGPQPIPRPEAARPGGPPPWAGLWGTGERLCVTLDQVRAAVAARGELPESGQETDPRSAVLVAVWEEVGAARVLLTRRTVWLRSHSGQVAFPGGRVEPGETLVDAALRESWEEVGLNPRSVEVIGGLGRLHTISSQSGIFPFLGILPGRPAIHPNPAEVDRVFDVGLGELMEEGVFHEEIWGVGGVERPIYFFEVDGETVWGATARILHELLSAVAGVSAREEGHEEGRDGQRREQ